jgi:hypothetical protein
MLKVRLERYGKSSEEKSRPELDFNPAGTIFPLEESYA